MADLKSRREQLAGYRQSTEAMDAVIARRTAPKGLLKCPRRILIAGFFPTKKEVTQRTNRGVGQEWRCMATAFNFKKLMRIWETLRTPPRDASAAVAA